mmetsp:Transcript_5916/g.21111  ORF Transcript_5916/g.21111 Transcript_5916/m.21111 type:complete len:231 (+) Transcript_5916:1691-2383(+)
MKESAYDGPGIDMPNSMMTTATDAMLSLSASAPMIMMSTMEPSHGKTRNSIASYAHCADQYDHADEPMMNCWCLLRCSFSLTMLNAWRPPMTQKPIAMYSPCTPPAMNCGSSCEALLATFGNGQKMDSTASPDEAAVAAAADAAARAMPVVAEATKPAPSRMLITIGRPFVSDVLYRIVALGVPPDDWKSSAAAWSSWLSRYRRKSSVVVDGTCVTVGMPSPAGDTPCAM